MHLFLLPICFFAVLLISSSSSSSIVVSVSAFTDTHGNFSLPPRLDADPSQHEDNWAVIVSSSKYWHNFRQSSDIFLLYQQLRVNGFPDDKILLFISENHACDKRNPDVGHAPCSSETNFPNKTVFGPEVSIDFEGYNADAHSFLRALYGTQDASRTSKSKQLRSTEKSNVFIFISSHSGEFFTKFQDYEFLSAYQISHAFQEMYRLGKYNRMLFVVDTCKASTLFELIDAPNIVSLASSGPTDDGMSHTAHYNSRLAAHSFDGLASELFDFVAHDQVQQRKGKRKQSASIRDMFSSLKHNKWVTSNVSFSHPEQYYHRQGTPDVLYSSSWTVNDFFVQKGRGTDEKNRRAKNQNPLSKLDEDFVFWMS